MNYKNLSGMTLSALAGTVACLPTLAQQKTAVKSVTPQRPNIVLIITDQQYINKMSYMGDPSLNTPTMDRIARDGYTFTQSYCTFPLSIPQRFTMFTGAYPADFGVRNNPKKGNDGSINFEAIAQQQPRMLANLFNAAGYDTYYGGKEHLISPQSNDDAGYYGFKTIYAATMERRQELGRDAVEFLSKKSPKDKPFLMVVSYINPHDICEYDDYANYDNLTPKTLKTKAEGIKRVKQYVAQAGEYPEEKFYDEICPPLPENYPRTYGEPAGIPGKYSDYTIKQWRMHRWVYDRLTEEADSNIAPVFEALEKGGFLDNTIIVFTADHGEMDGSHGMEHKLAPFREAQNVPFIFSGPGILKGKIDRQNTVNTGIDLLPTLCDLASIKTDGKYPGISMKPLITGKTEKLDRRYIFTESSNWYQVVKDGRYKYTVIEQPGHPDMLIDLNVDPGEMINQVTNPAYDKIRKDLAQKLEQELTKRGIKLGVRSGNESE
jgi:choline-sulfatase